MPFNSLTFEELISDLEIRFYLNGFTVLASSVLRSLENLNKQL